jgi:hypothetical protein
VGRQPHLSIRKGGTLKKVSELNKEINESIRIEKQRRNRITFLTVITLIFAALVLGALLGGV